MTKSKAPAATPQAPEPPAPSPVVTPQQPVQQQYYQPAYTPRPPRKATYPGLEFSLAVVSILASAWLFVGAIAGSIGVFGGHAASYDGLTTFFLSHLGGYSGVVITSLLSVLFAGLALVLFQRSNDAFEADGYRGVTQAGAAVAIIKTLLLAGTTVAVGLTPLLTIQKGSDVGPVYLYSFLPLVISTALFALVAWYMIKLVGKHKVGGLFATILLIVASIVFVLGFVAVIVKSHSKSSSYTPSTSESRDSSSPSQRGGSDRPSTFDNRTDDGASSSSGSNAYMQCYDEYRRTEDTAAYSKCIQDAY